MPNKKNQKNKQKKEVLFFNLLLQKVIKKMKGKK